MRTIQSEFKKHGFDNEISEMRKNKSEKQKKMTRREIEDLMGMYRDTYTRRNGAIRRK